MRAFNVNSDEAIKLTAKLEKLNRSAFPSAVKNTLNRAAFETKKNIPLVSSKEFTTRQKTFFKRFSTVSKATGFDVNKMTSIAGIDSSLNYQLAENLESQEVGGMVKGKKLIPHDDSRVSRSQNKRVSARNHLNKVKLHNASKAFRASKGSRGSKFVSAVMSTVKRGKKHMLLKSGGRGMVYELTSVSSNSKRKKLNFKVKKLYSVRRNKNHNVTGTSFMRKSAILAAKDFNDFYLENANYQFNKVLKK